MIGPNARPPEPGWRQCDRLPVVRGLSTRRAACASVRGQVVHAVGVAAASAPRSPGSAAAPGWQRPGVEVIFFDAEDRELGRQQRQAAA